MRQLLYVSTAKRQFSEAELESLLVRSRGQNKLKNITGMLLYTEDGFVQVLEGPPAAMEETLEIIRKDDRHTGIKILLDWDAPRAFPDWSMGFKLSESRDAAAFALSAAIASSKQGPTVAVEILALLHTYYVAQERAA